MEMDIKLSGHQKLKALMREALTLLCKNRLSYQNHFSIEATIGVTVDDSNVLLLSVNELVSRSDSVDQQLGVPDETGSLDMDCSLEVASSQPSRRKRRVQPSRTENAKSPPTKAQRQSPKSEILPVHQYKTVVVKPETSPERSTTRASVSATASVTHPSAEHTPGEVGQHNNDNIDLEDGLSTPDVNDTNQVLKTSRRSHRCRRVHTSSDINVASVRPSQKYQLDHRTKSLRYVEAVEILANRYEFPISYEPPYRPKGGQMFIVSAENDEDRLNAWRNDHYHWKLNQGVGTFPTRTADFKIKKCVHKLSRTGTFTRHAWFLAVNPYAVLIHYMGDETEAESVDSGQLSVVSRSQCIDRPEPEADLVEYASDVHDADSPSTDQTERVNSGYVVHDTPSQSIQGIQSVHDTYGPNVDGANAQSTDEIYTEHS